MDYSYPLHSLSLIIISYHSFSLLQEKFYSLHLLSFHTISLISIIFTASISHNLIPSPSFPFLPIPYLTLPKGNNRPFWEKWLWSNTLRKVSDEFLIDLMAHMGVAHTSLWGKSLSPFFPFEAGNTSHWYDGTLLRDLFSYLYSLAVGRDPPTVPMVSSSNNFWQSANCLCLVVPSLITRFWLTFPENLNKFAYNDMVRWNLNSIGLYCQIRRSFHFPSMSILSFTFRWKVPLQLIWKSLSLWKSLFVDRKRQ